MSKKNLPKEAIQDKILAFIVSTFIAILMGITTWDLWFHTDWTEAQRFWERGPLIVGFTAFALILSYVVDRTRTGEET